MMKCCVEGCEKDAMYKKVSLCQKHYFRVMRNGTTDTIKSRNYRSRNKAGYQLLYEPSHKLSQSNGYVYEHRFVYYNEKNMNPDKCEICGCFIDWDILHIDHIDNDVTNNKKENLRATCRACNTFRGISSVSMSKQPIEINGVVMSAQEWSRQDGVSVTGATIRNRIASGMSPHDAVYSIKVTHKNKIPSKKEKIFDRLRSKS